MPKSSIVQKVRQKLRDKKPPEVPDKDAPKVRKHSVFLPNTKGDKRRR